VIRVKSGPAPRLFLETEMKFREWLLEQIKDERENCANSKEHLWSQAAGAMDAYRLALEEYDRVLAEAPTVYGIGTPGEPYDGDEDYWWTTRSGEDTHTAKLVQIETIE
jgi:hypothetical protein